MVHAAALRRITVPTAELTIAELVLLDPLWGVETMGEECSYSSGTTSG